MALLPNNDKYRWTEGDNIIGQAEMKIAQLLTVNGGDLNSPAVVAILQDTGAKLDAVLDVNIRRWPDGTYRVVIEKSG